MQGSVYKAKSQQLELMFLMQYNLNVPVHFYKNSMNIRMFCQKRHRDRRMHDFLVIMKAVDFCPNALSCVPACQEESISALHVSTGPTVIAFVGTRVIFFRMYGHFELYCTNEYFPNFYGKPRIDSGKC